MPDVISEWKERINACQIPIFQSTADFFHQRKGLAGTSISMLCGSLEYDPGMCLNLLRAAGHNRRTRVNTVSHAMLLLGLPNVINRPEGLSKIESIKSAKTRYLIQKTFSKAYHSSAYARQWAKIKKSKSIEEIHTASLNSYFMEYLICLCQPELILKLEALQRQNIAPAESEKRIFGFTLKELAYEIAKDWYLPKLMIETLEDNDSTSDKVKCVILSRRLADESALGWYHSGTESVMLAASEFLKQPLDLLSNEIHKTAVLAARSSFNVYSPASPAAISLNQLPTLKPVAAKVKTRKIPSRKDTLKKCLYQISHNRDLNYQEIINVIFKGLNQGLGLKRVFFALLSEDKQYLQIKFAIDQQSNKELRRLRLPLSKNSLFERLMRKPQAFWMREDNRKKYCLLLPKSYIETINSDIFFAMSLFIKGKPVGLFYADMGKGNKLGEIQFKYFKQLCKLTTQALEQITNKHSSQKNKSVQTEKKAVNA